MLKSTFRKVHSLPKLIASILLCTSSGFIGGFLTVSAISSWYIFLEKPFFTPPNWIFGPVWTVLYTLMGVSLYLIWNIGFKTKKQKIARTYFLIQLGLNFLWSPAFFGLQSPLFGLLIIVPLWFFIILTIRAFFPISRVAAWLLVPYLLWVSYATILNVAIVILN